MYAPVLLLPAPIFSLFPYTTLFRSRGSDRRSSRSCIAAALVEERSVQRRALDGLLHLCGGDRGCIDDGRLQYTHRSEEHTCELQSRRDLVCGRLLEKKKVVCIGLCA